MDNATMRPARDAITAYWAAANARDWDAFGGLLADDVIYTNPQTRERVRGRPAYIRYNTEGFPGEWRLAVQRIVADERAGASWIQMTEPDDTYPGVCFFEFDDHGLIATITDFWPEPAELPPGRAHLSERF